MRDEFVQGLNDLLDIDHDAVTNTLAAEYDLSPDSLLFKKPQSYDKGGVKVITALALINMITQYDVQPVFEDGVIQRFE